MIIVNIALKQEDIKALLETEGFKFVKKQGLKLFFETDAEDKAAEANRAKAIIKGSEWGQGLFFSTGVA
ncbi:hypothetical protein ACFO26_08805 [Lactococcus nasutitermitis]|uniref:Uncharacterized protein n=1 Tax=Lactococcus nasutitermitis TaxID=1652957 RepID=A0ABV9JES3_9LACT|nr:hypothetical protein [Lactococcus nasutitermitis]